MRFVFGTLLALVGVFALVGFAVMLGALRSARLERERAGAGEGADGEGAGGGHSDGVSVRERIARYVGPVDPAMALLNPPGRVAAEFFSALCGFPGLGWLMSGSVFAGLVLLCLGPAVVWGVYPVFLVLTGGLADGPFVAVQYLPGLALGSSLALGYREVQLAKRRRRHAEALRTAK